MSENQDFFFIWPNIIPPFRSISNTCIYSNVPKVFVIFNDVALRFDSAEYVKIA